MRTILKSIGLAAVAAGAIGCAGLPPERQPLKLEDLQALSRQKLATDAVIEQIEQRGLAFELTPEQRTQFKSAGMKEPLLRYLQGRAAGVQAAQKAAAFRDGFNDFDCRYLLPLYPFPARYLYLPPPARR